MAKKANNINSLQQQLQNSGFTLSTGPTLIEDDSEQDTLLPIEVLDKKITNSIMNFNNLLEDMSAVESRKKILWKQIFEYALIDRKNAYLLFSDLYQTVISNPTEHAIHGPTLSKYLERMSKANDQLLKLAEIVDDETKVQNDQNFSEDNIYEEMNKKR
jgi:hypothetical protein